MKKFEDRQFTAYYNRIMLVTFCVVLVISFALMGLQVRNQSRHDDAQLVERFKTRSIAIDNLIVSVTEHLNLMQAKAGAYFLDPVRQPSLLYAALTDSEDPRNPQYQLDQVPPPYAPALVGNLTGDGTLAQLPAATRAELEMALGLNSLFQGVQKNIPNAAWVYYTSAARFINIYPWVPSGTARFSEQLYRKPFYQVGLPASNPQRRIQWTPLYVDEYGKGMMVTATKPLYRGDTFMGNLSIDITLDELTPYVRDFSDAGGELMIVNQVGELIAHPTATSARDTRVRRFADVLPDPLRGAADTLFQARPLVPTRVQGHATLWYEMKHAPWKIVFVEPEPGLPERVFSRAGLPFLVLLGGLSVMLATMRTLTFRQFIYPAERLVQHIFLESEGRASPPGTLPRQWLPWFGAVSTAFAQNRKLIEEINLKNQQLTDMNISLERYTPRFILLLTLDQGVGSTTLGHCFADTLARKDPSKTTVYMEFPAPERLAQQMGLDGAQQVFRHPNGYDIWTRYDLGQIPEAGVSALLMAKVLHKYHNVVIGAAAQGPDEGLIDPALEAMFRYAKAVILVVPPGRADDPAVRQTLRQIKKSVRQDQAHVYLLANQLQPGQAPAAAADFEIPWLGAEARVGQAAFACPPAAAAVIGKLVDRVERVHQIAAFIPTTIGVDRPTDTAEYVQRALTYFSQRFGGATSSQAKGAWNSESAGVVSEVVYVVVSYTTEEDLSRHVDEVIDFVKQLKHELGQEAMAIEINKKLMLI